MLPLTLVLDWPWTLAMPHPTTWAAALGVGLLSTELAYVLYFRILAASGAINLLLVTFVIPIGAILLGAVVLGETLLPRHSVGMARQNPPVRRPSSTVHEKPPSRSCSGHIQHAGPSV